MAGRRAGAKNLQGVCGISLIRMLLRVTVAVIGMKIVSVQLSVRVTGGSLRRVQTRMGRQHSHEQKAEKAGEHANPSGNCSGASDYQLTRILYAKPKYDWR